MPLLDTTSDIDRLIAESQAAARKARHAAPDGLWGAFKQYLTDAMPGGNLTPEWTPERVQTAGNLAGDFTPVLGGFKGFTEEAAAGNPWWAAFNAGTIPVDMLTAGIGGTALRAGAKSAKGLSKAAKAKEAAAAKRKAKRAAQLEKVRQRLDEALAGKPKANLPFRQQRVKNREGVGKMAVHEYSLDPKLTTGTKSSGLDTGTIYELPASDEALQYFQEAAKNAQGGAESLSDDISRLKGGRVFMSADGRSGAVLTPDGEVVGKFVHPDHQGGDTETVFQHLLGQEGGQLQTPPLVPKSKSPFKLSEDVQGVGMDNPSAIYAGAPPAKEASPDRRFIEYPETGAPTLTYYPPDPKKGKKTGKFGFSKTPTEDAQQVALLRQRAQEEIDAGTAPRFFDESQRYYADPTAYGEGFDTLSLLPAQEKTLNKWLAKQDTAEAREILRNAYKAGSQDPNAIDWYAVGQLQDAFRAKYGQDQGDALFKEVFADAMAATTGGADPTSNLLMSHYGNFLKGRGMDVPTGPNPKGEIGTASYKFPFPIGGRYAGSNMENYQKNIMIGSDGINPETNPKRYNFSRNFLGDMDRATIDEQMMGAFNVGAAPTYYGIEEGVVRDLAKEAGVKPGNYQDASWFGLKALKEGDVKGKPMISHINDMLYRTSQVTGETMEEVLDRYLSSKGAMYSGLLPLGLGAGLGYGMLNPPEDPDTL